MIYAIGVILFALGICVSIALHEAGHLATAKMFGMKVRRYFVGFGPRIFSFRRGETEYGLKAIPLGGFCDIAGMTALDEVTKEEAPRAMWRYPVWKRTVVLAAGSVTHFILGLFIVYIGAISIGLLNFTASPEVSAMTCTRDAKSEEQARALRDIPCGPSDPTPAKDAGFQPGDVITSVSGKPVETYLDVKEIVNNRAGAVTMTVDRDGESVPLVVDVSSVMRPVADEDGNFTVSQVGMIGVAFPSEWTYGPIEAIGESFAYTGTMFERTWEALLRFPERVPKVVEAIFGEERDPDTPVSVVGASRLGGEAVERGFWEFFLLLLASLNFFIGIFNLLPLLPLDGGHIAVTWYEKVRDWLRRLRGQPAGGPVDYNKLATVTMVLVVIGGAVVLLTVTADIVNPIRLPGN